jgi:hypothetical protein
MRSYHNQTNVITLHSEDSPKYVNYHNNYYNGRFAAPITKLPTCAPNSHYAELKNMPKNPLIGYTFWCPHKQ